MTRTKSIDCGVVVDWSKLQQSPLNARWEIVDRQAGRVDFNPVRRKIAIVGANHCPALAPILEDHTWEVWSCNMLVTRCLDSAYKFRADRWFELHQLKAQNDMDWSWIKACPVPLYCAECPDVDAVPRAVQFPLAEMIANGARSYYHCTFAYQVAFALSLPHVEKIGIYGVNLPQGSMRERSLERASLEYWLGVAEGRGVAVVSPVVGRTGLLHSPYLYGFDYTEEAQWVREQMLGLRNIAQNTDWTIKIP